ncbi:hypothetical protein, partial [Erwinia amylovora]|uniref:hypothetical protein n=1 Tax=Erwinia amylovora TaxID=552 RepID=UPI003D6EF8B7
ARGQRRPLYSSMECLGGDDIGGGCSGISTLVAVEVYLVERAVAVECDGMVTKGARKDLGRPKSTPVENKNALMAFLK